MVHRTICMYDATGIRNVAWDGIALEAAQFKKMEKSDFLVFVIVILYCFKAVIQNCSEKELL